MKKFIVVALAAALAVFFVVPAGAFEGKFEAVLIYDINVMSTDSEYQQNTMQNPNDEDWDYTEVNLNPFGYVGFRLEDKNVGVRVNFAPRGWDDDAEGNVVHDPVLLRQHYGWWDVNDWFQLLVGQLASKHSRLGPTNIYSSRASMSNDMAGVFTYGLAHGNIFPRRIPQIQGNFKLHPTTLLQIAICDPDTTEVNNLPADPNGLVVAAGFTTGAGSQFLESEESTIPRIDVTLQMDFGPIGIYPSIAYGEHHFDTDGNFNPGFDADLEWWNFALPVTFSMAGFTIEGELNWGENWGNSNMYPHGDLGTAAGASLGHDWPKNGGGGTLPTSRAVLDANGNVQDTECLGFWIEARYKFGIFTPGIVYGYQKHENTDLGAFNFKTDRDWIGLHMNIAAAPHWTITPYVSFYDQGDNEFENTPALNLSLGDVTVYGINFIIAF